MNEQQLKDLRRKISRRWPLLSGDPKAHAQLEYILEEAGLLARPRRRFRLKQTPLVVPTQANQ
jgi:hypothetical protein